MVFSELALGFLTNLLYDSSKKIPGEIFDNSSKVYDKAIEEFSKKNFKLSRIQIDTFFHQNNVERAIKKYLTNPDKLECSNVLIQEFFELFSEEDFSREDADLILNTFFGTIDTEIEKYPELIVYLDHYLAKITYCEVRETNHGIQELSKGVQEISQTVHEINKVVNESRLDQSSKEVDIDFDESIKKYLNKIIKEEGKNGISEVYTELSAKEILPVTLKFRDEENDREQEFEVLELVEKEEKLIISGESGSGKTTTLRWLNYIFATSYLEGKNESIPLYIELNSYIGEERFIKKPFDAYVTMKAEGRGISKDTLKTILEGKAIILLDGFDLLSPTDEFNPFDKISNFITDYNNCRFVISSRPGFFESIKSNFKVSELEKLTDEKIEIFINSYVSNEELANSLKDKILSNQQLKSILSNPMMLYIAIKVAMGRKGQLDDLLPSNRSELYEAFISTLFSHQEEKGKHLNADRVQIENALTDLYFKLQCWNEVSCKYGEALKIVKRSAEDDTFRKTTSQDILEDCCKIGLLVEKDSEIEYGIHQSFQEYFAAIKLKELFESKFDVSEAFSHPKWEEVIIFTSEMLDCSDEFIDSMISKGELFLASRCISKASDETKEKLCALLTDKVDSKYDMEKVYAIESLGKIGNVGISIIIEALNDEESYLRGNAAEALGNIGSDTAVQPLINALKDKSSHVRWRAIKALENIGSDTAMQPLIYALKDEESYLRGYAAEALGNIGSNTAVQPLVNALKDKDKFVRGDVAKALGNIGADTAVQPLINALKDKNSYVRGVVAKALGNIGSDIAVQTLISALRDEYTFVRLSAAEALGKIGSKTVVQLLINALKDEDREVRKSAAEALGNIKSDTSIQPLIKALNDEYSYVRESAAEALGNIGSDTAVQPLIYALKDKSSYVRLSAAEALGDIGSDTAVQPLINALKDKRSYVRGFVAEALGKIGSNAAVQPLVKALEDEDREVRRSAVGALGDIGSDTAVQPLIKALNDEYSYVRESAAKVLGNMKSQTSVVPLINALDDEDREVRKSAAEALGNIKSDTSIQPLIKALNDEYSYVRESAAEALGKIGSNAAVQPLIKALNDEHSYVRESAAEALGNIKSDVAVHPLINALKDEDRQVRESAAEALGNIGSETAVQLLINVLEDESRQVRESAAEALGNIESNTAVQPLIYSLKDKSSYVRRSVAEALGKICTVKNEKQLKNILESDHDFSANTAFEILYEIEKKERSKIILFEDLKKINKITPKYRVFVSSVQKELENERVTIQDTMENDPFISVHYTSLLYEYEPAYPEKTLEGCLNALNSCQVYMLIVGVKYGTLVGEISITQREYRYAKEKNLPILIFIKGERNIEREQGTEALLREIESDDFKYKRFRNVIDLRDEVKESLKKLLQEDKFLKS